MIARTSRAGFTILELSVVLVIIALITAMGINAGMGVVETAKRTSTENKLTAIEKALMTFRVNNNRLPCPGDLTLTNASANYGVEGSPIGYCLGGSPSATKDNGGGMDDYHTVEGSVPVKALNLPDEYMFDGWGRKISYAVDIGATDVDAFSVVYPHESCGIIVEDANHTSRAPAGAMYVLISFGPNGYGGYLPTGTPITTGSSISADEITNAHIGGLTREFIQKDITGDVAAGTNVFDDIVRFKSRWQMQTPADHASSFSNYKGAQFFAGFDSGSPGLYGFKNHCGLWQFDADFPSADFSGSMVLPGITGDNKHLFIYSKNEGCSAVTIDGNGTYTVESAPLKYDGSSCPNTSTVTLSVANNGYVAIVADGELMLWKLVGNNFIPLNMMTAIYTAGSGVPTKVIPSPPTGAVLSKNAEYMAANDTSTAVKIYKRKGDKFIMLPDARQPTPSQDVVNNSVTFSPDGKFFAVAAKTIIEVWPITGEADQFSDAYKIQLTPAGLDTQTFAIAFSPDGKYFAAVGGNGGQENIQIYKIDAVNKNPIDATAFTEITGFGDWNVSDPSYAGSSVAFSPDSNYVVMATPQGVIILRRISPTQFTWAYMYHPHWLGPAAATGVAYHH